MNNDYFGWRRMSWNQKLSFLLGDGPAPSTNHDVNLQWTRMEICFYHYLLAHAHAYDTRPSESLDVKNVNKNIGIHPPVIHPSGASALAPSFYGGSAIQLELDQNGRRRFYCATSVWQGTWPVVLLAGTTPSCSLRGVGSASP